MRQRAGGIDGGADPLQMRLRTQRPQFGGLIVRRAHLQAGNRGAEFFHQLVINPGLGVNPAGGGAVLTGIIETKGPYALHHRVDIRIIKDDNRRFPAQFHMGTLNRRRGVADNMRAGGNRTGQRHHAHLRMGGERIADGSAAAKQHVKHPGGENLFCQFAQLQRGQGGNLRRFDHHAVAGGQRRGQFPGRHHQRVVPRRDGGHHANRIAADHGGVAFEILTRRHTRQTARRPGKEAEHIGDCRQFIVDHAVQRLAAVERFKLSQRLRMFVNHVRQRQQAFGAAPGRGLAPADKGLVCGLNRGLNLRRRGFGNRHDLFTGGRIKHRHSLAFPSH